MVTQGWQRTGWMLLALAILAAALWLRIAGSFVHPLWLDEAYSAYAADKGWAFLWQIVPQYETHPPFYYSLLRGWTLIFGDGLIALRALGVTAAILTLGAALVSADAAGRLMRLKAGSRIWLVLATLAIVAVAPPLVDMARQVRPYPVMILVYAAGMAALLRMAARDRIGGAPYAAYLACLALMLWLHNLGPLYAAAMGLAFLTLMLRPGLERRDWAILAGGHVLVALAWLPALLILIDQAPTWVSSTWLHFRPDLLTRQLSWLYATTADWGRIAAGLLALIGIAHLWRARRGRVAMALLLLALLPVCLAILISATIAPVFIVRIMTAVALPFYLLIAIGVAGMMGWRRLPALAVLVLLLWPMGGGSFARRAPMQDWYGAIAWLEQRLKPGDIVWAYPNEGALPFDRAARDRGLPIASRPIPGPIPALNPPTGSWYVSGSRGVPSLDRTHLRALARSAEAQRIKTIWLLRLGPWAYDKGDILVKELKAAGREQVARYRDGPIDIVGLKRIPALPPVPAPQQPQP